MSRDSSRGSTSLRSPTIALRAHVFPFFYCRAFEKVRKTVHARMQTTVRFSCETRELMQRGVTEIRKKVVFRYSNAHSSRLYTSLAHLITAVMRRGGRSEFQRRAAALSRRSPPRSDSHGKHRPPSDTAHHHPPRLPSLPFPSSPSDDPRAALNRHSRS